MTSQDDPGQQPELTLDSIGSGLPLVEGKEKPDAIDRLEDLQTKKAHLENKLSRARIKDVKADRKLRKKYANRILRFLEWYAAGVAVLVVFDGFHLFRFHLEKEVTATLLVARLSPLLAWSGSSQEDCSDPRPALTSSSHHWPTLPQRVAYFGQYPETSSCRFY